jgi:plasmid stability protein
MGFFPIMEVIMATITVKNIPDPTYKTLKQLAAEHHRSVNSEIIHLIEKATKSNKIDPNQHLLIAKTLRQKTKKYVITDDTLSELKNEGRP